MAKGAVALLIRGVTGSWTAELWTARFKDLCPDRRVVQMPDAAIDPLAVQYAVVWAPAPGDLQAFAKLRVIFNLGAGVDALMVDETLPDVPLVRVAVPDLTSRVSEYVLLHVLMHHRQDPYLRQAQRERRWAPRPQWPAAAITVGIMGLGVLGSDAAALLARVGFRVVGWSRGPRQIDGVECFHGADALDSFLCRTNILVCLLPLTPDTRKILNRGVFTRLNRTSRLGAPVVINVGRGALQDEADILACLDDGTLGAVSLDVFNEEPLSHASPLWNHPRVVLTPHNAGATDPIVVSNYVLQQITEFEAGGKLENLVDRDRGY